MERYIIGIDSGTTGIKAVLFDGNPERGFRGNQETAVHWRGCGSAAGRYAL